MKGKQRGGQGSGVRLYEEGRGNFWILSKPTVSSSFILFTHVHVGQGWVALLMPVTILWSM